MARKVFFSFHYEMDNWRAGQVRNSNVVKLNVQSAGFIDSASWESVKKQGDDGIKRWISVQMLGTSVTVVLIGAQTSERDWVQHEIKESYKRGNGLIGVYVHNVKDALGRTAMQGANPFAKLFFKNGNALSSRVRTYDWVWEDGRRNLSSWIEEAYQRRQNGGL